MIIFTKLYVSTKQMVNYHSKTHECELAIAWKFYISILFFLFIF